MNNLTEETLKSVMKLALEKASEAAMDKCSELRRKAQHGNQMLDACGGAFISLDLDGRSKQAKFLRSIPQPIENVRIAYDKRNGLTIFLLPA
ncbi:hypothetical protein SRRS_07670 [Sporomusa rhizae]|uniref:hypothetical protein n=1 Tax=Sporomusa rhizae TaxID=357999 RepID=UPI00352ABBA5